MVAEQPKRSSVGRHGEMAARIASESKYDNSLVCECEDVTVGEVNYAVNELDVHNLIDLRRRTRVGMGTCQGNSVPVVRQDCWARRIIAPKRRKRIWLRS